MEYRVLGRTGYSISSISFGAWAIGGDAWGGADDATSLTALHRAADLGVNCFDTADVYGKPAERNPAQVEENVRAAALPPLSAAAMTRARAVYDTHFRAAIHDRW